MLLKKFGALKFRSRSFAEMVASQRVVESAATAPVALNDSVLFYFRYTSLSLSLSLFLTRARARARGFASTLPRTLYWLAISVSIRLARVRGRFLSLNEI
jgi:hypothetical protein